jgi:hypothetical protein
MSASVVPPLPAPAPPAKADASDADDATVRCDACGAAVPAADEDEDSFALPGAGVYVWTRGEEVRFEKAPLCDQCASAIGMTALARWEIEEEEG